MAAPEVYSFSAMSGRHQIDFCAGCEFDSNNYEREPEGKCPLFVCLHDSTKPRWGPGSEVYYCGKCLAKAYPELDATAIKGILPHHIIYFNQCKNMLDLNIPDGPLNGFIIHAKYSIYDVCVTQGKEQKVDILQQLHEWGATLSTSLTKDTFAVIIDNSCKEILRVMDLNHPKFAVARNLNIPVISDEIVQILDKTFYTTRWLIEDIANAFQSVKVSDWGQFDLNKIKKRVLDGPRDTSDVPAGALGVAAVSEAGEGGAPLQDSESEEAEGGAAQGSESEEAAATSQDSQEAGGAPDPEGGARAAAATAGAGLLRGVRGRSSGRDELLMDWEDTDESSDGTSDNADTNVMRREQVRGGDRADSAAHQGHGSNHDSSSSSSSSSQEPAQRKSISGDDVSLDSMSNLDDEDGMEIDSTEEERLLADDAELLLFHEDGHQVSPAPMSVENSVPAPAARPSSLNEGRLGDRDHVSPDLQQDEGPVLKKARWDNNSLSSSQDVEDESDGDDSGSDGQWQPSVVNTNYLEGSATLDLSMTIIRPHPMCGLKDVRLLKQKPEDASSLVATRFTEKGTTEFAIVLLLLDVTTERLPTIWVARGCTHDNPMDIKSEQREFKSDERDKAVTEFHQIVYELTGDYHGHLKKKWNENEPNIFTTLHSMIEKDAPNLMSQSIHPILHSFFSGPFFQLPEIKCSVPLSPTMQTLPLLGISDHYLLRIKKKVKDCARGPFNEEMAWNLTRMLFQSWPQARVISKVNSWKELEEHLLNFELTITKIKEELKCCVGQLIRSEDFSMQPVLKYHTEIKQSLCLSPLTKKHTLWKSLENSALKGVEKGFAVETILKVSHPEPVQEATAETPHHLLWAEVPDADLPLRDIIKNGIPFSNRQYGFYDIPNPNGRMVLRTRDETGEYACALACSIHLGNMLSIRSRNHLTALRQSTSGTGRVAAGHESVLLQGKKVPDDKQNKKIGPNLVMACGTLVDNPQQMAAGDQWLGKNNLFKVRRTKTLFPRYLVIMRRSMEQK